jgi:predicted RNA methylase
MSLKEQLKSPGWQPRRADVPSLFAQLAEPDRDAGELAERALARLGLPAAREAIERFPSSAPPARGRLCRLIGRVAQDTPASELRAFLVAALDDRDAKTRRNAIITLGKLGGAGVDAALRARFCDGTVAEQRSIADALGKLGGAEALALLDALTTDDAELRRIADEARLKLRRTLGRAEPGRIDAEARPPRPLPVRLHCRYGLALLCADELGRDFRPRVLDEETVDATLRGPLSSLWRARTALRFVLPLRTGGARDPGGALVAALGSPEARAVFAAFTVGAPRYRIEWASGGHRRGLTFRTAQAVARAAPELVNDPTSSLWEAIVDETQGISVELWPRGLEDPRFAYRRAHVPASSHPTLAAALARVAGARADDVVWDPFVGAGTELVERARLGPFRALYGTDLDQAALARARENLAAAGVAAEVSFGDARTFIPPAPPTLILTNPPMGRRVLNKTLTGALYASFLAHAAEVLAPGGRVVWISPRGDETARAAERLGLRASFRRRVDMAGFWGELQSFTMPGP